MILIVGISLLSVNLAVGGDAALKKDIDVVLKQGRGTPEGRAAWDRLSQAKPDAEPMLLDAIYKMPDARLIEGRFMTVNHGFSTPRERLAAAEYMKTFVEEMIASGFIARSIERHAVKGLSAVK